MYKGLIVYGQDTAHVILFPVELSNSAWKVTYEHIKYIQNIHVTDFEITKTNLGILNLGISTTIGKTFS
jgi:hypothetical protein